MEMGNKKPSFCVNYGNYVSQADAWLLKQHSELWSQPTALYNQVHYSQNMKVNNQCNVLPSAAVIFHTLILILRILLEIEAIVIRRK